MQILWKYLKPYKWLAIFSMVLAAIAQALSFLDPVIFGKILDNYALNPGNRSERELITGVLWLLALAIAVAIAAKAAKALQEYVLRIVVQKFGKSVFDDGLKQTLRLSYQEFEDQRSGETLSILQKTRRDTENFLSSFINIVFSTLVGISFLIYYAITKHWALIPVFLIGVLLLGGLTGLLSKKIKTIQRKIFRENAVMSGNITESLRNIELVKSLGLTYPEIRRLRQHTQEIYDLEMSKVKKLRTLTFFQGTILTILKQSILFILLWLIFRNALSAGEVISMQFISTAIIGPLQDLGSIILSYREAEGSLQVFNELMQKQPLISIDVHANYNVSLETIYSMGPRLLAVILTLLLTLVTVDTIMQEIATKSTNIDEKKIAVLAALRIASQLAMVESELNREKQKEKQLIETINRELNSLEA